MSLKVLSLIWLVTCVSSQASAEENCNTQLDLNIFSISVIVSDFSLLLKWDLATTTTCPILYHVTLTDEELGALDLYVEDNSALVNVTFSPCISYEAEVKAINKAFPTVEGPPRSSSFRFSPRAQEMPRLKSLNVGPESINMTWALEGATNRCPLTALYVVGSGDNIVTVPLNGVQGLETVPVTIGSLLPNTMYSFNVVVENSAGYSPANILSVQTLKN